MEIITLQGRLNLHKSAAKEVISPQERTGEIKTTSRNVSYESGYGDSERFERGSAQSESNDSAGISMTSSVSSEGPVFNESGYSSSSSKRDCRNENTTSDYHDNSVTYCSNDVFPYDKSSPGVGDRLPLSPITNGVVATGTDDFNPASSVTIPPCSHTTTTTPTYDDKTKQCRNTDTITAGDTLDKSQLRRNGSTDGHNGAGDGANISYILGKSEQIERA